MSSKVADDRRFKISKIMLILHMLKEELDNLETKMELLRDARATVKQNIKELNAQRGLLNDEATKVVALEVRMGKCGRPPMALRRNLLKINSNPPFFVFPM